MSLTVELYPCLPLGKVDRITIQQGCWIGRCSADADIEPARAEVDRCLKAGPYGGKAGLDGDELTLAADTENAFDAGAIHPGGRAGVPGPTAASDMRCDGIDVRSHDVGLHFVAAGRLGRERVIDRVEQ